MVLKVGDSASVVKRFSVEDVKAFSELSEDRNTLHLEDLAAKSAGFEGIVVHGVLCMGLLSAAIGTKVKMAKDVFQHNSYSVSWPQVRSTEHKRSISFDPSSLETPSQPSPL